MGVVTVSSSASRSLLGLSTRFSARFCTLKRPLIVVSFKSDKTKNKSLVAPKESISLPIETSIKNEKKPRRASKRTERVHAVTLDEASPSTLELDYSEAAAKLESIFKRSLETATFDTEVKDHPVKKRQRRRKRIVEDDEEAKKGIADNVVRNRRKSLKRLSLNQRIALLKAKEEMIASSHKRKLKEDTEDEKLDKLVREYSGATDLASLDWKKMKIPPVLPSSDHTWLFKLMQPMKAILQVKENMQNDLGREPTDGEVAVATNMNASEVRKNLQVGRAARSKLIKHNLRLVLFVMNKYFQDFANGPRFQDLCQEGVKGLITAIDRFEPKRKFRLSTYGLFWIRHAIVRSMTTSSLFKVPFGLESIRVEVQKVKLELQFELQRMPTDEEIIERVGLSPERYHDVMNASKTIISLHSRHKTTQEELINGLTDLDSVDGDKRKQPALLRLALDDVLDSLKPKESLVIRQRYGLDGRGNRTLGEIAGNLNISREMVRKHEIKALMKLKHPARVDYLRQYIF